MTRPGGCDVTTGIGIGTRYRYWWRSKVWESANSGIGLSLEITLSVGWFFLQGHFFVQTSNLKAKIFAPFHFCLSKTATLRISNVVWQCYLSEVGNFLMVLCDKYIQDTAY